MEKEFVLKDWLLVEQDNDNTKEVLPNSFKRFIINDDNKASEWKPDRGKFFHLLGVATKDGHHFVAGDLIITSPIIVIYRANDTLFAVTKHGSRYRLDLDDMNLICAHR